MPLVYTIADHLYRLSVPDLHLDNDVLRITKSCLIAFPVYYAYNRAYVSCLHVVCLHVCMLPVCINPIPGGGPLRTPLQFFLCHGKRRKLFSSYLVTFLYFSLRTFQQKKVVRSGQVTRAGLLTPLQKSLQLRQS